MIILKKISESRNNIDRFGGRKIFLGTQDGIVQIFWIGL